MTAGLVVVGGGPAAHSAARAFREAGGSGSVQIISGDSTPPYERPPLSKDFLRGKAERADLSMEAPTFYPDHEIELHLAEQVVHLDVTDRSVLTDRHRRVVFEHCVLATGSTPTGIPVPGGDHPAVHRLRSLDDATALRIAASTARSGIVIGSGFIGCEAAASLARLGLSVVMVTTETHPQVERLGLAAAQRIERWLGDLGVRIAGSAAVEAIQDGRRLTLADGHQLEADVILAATGVSPNSDLAATAGLSIDQHRIRVDQHMRTSDAAIFAAGDVARAHHPAAGRHLTVEHWGDALSMGMVAGQNAAGGSESWSSAPGFWSEIGGHQLKYSAWGDGYDDARLVEHADDAFTVWYTTAGRMAGVLTHRSDADYEQGTSLLLSSGATP